MSGEATAQPTAEGAQPEANAAVAQPGQGRGDTEDHLAGLYDLSGAPEHLRPHLEEELRKINAGISRRFQEHAEQRNRWEPLEKIDGLSDVPAEDLEDLLTIRNMIAAATAEENPDTGELLDWWDKVGEHFGFFEDDGEGGQPETGGEEEQTPAWAQQLMERLDAAEQRLDGTDRQSLEQKAEQTVQDELKALAEKHSLDQKAQNRVLQLAYAYGGQPDALQRGLKDYFEITGQAEGDLLEGAEAAQTGPTTTGGQPATHQSEGLRFGDPRLREAAMARVKGQTSAGAAA